ncbi:MAG: LON peptidase substrate-binding domain-containing protein, partial [Phycisphaerae bacterium]
MADDAQREQTPERLPVLPLRGLVAFPGLVLTLQVGREASVTAVHAALAADHRILLV